MEGEVFVILEIEAGGPLQVAKRYLILKGRRFEVYQDLPVEGEVSDLAQSPWKQSNLNVSSIAQEVKCKTCKDNVATA
jgi:hypothetical protein